MAAPFMQKRCPVGGGPSSKTCPRWLLQFEQRISVLGRIILKSVRSVTAAPTGAQNEGQPEPLSNFCSDLNSGCLQPAHKKTPVSPASG
eukprot:CAMPEP_0205926206 /NCGR_PEP_ID=MMETSP1325-20131115/19881_1 /ASSEMBLY_ACC=CAM_ASM_000708 /TAXON_ID=236786 /ORGANISM="Florenciella sp., Strain RCC1007" /LENGTH=88 /DNA_ID=CAMNT_0053294889 /DNA_START=23 /DNA_END=285 /DNA_ORIENTATION=-